jgi:hypothetical protein
MRMRTVRTLPIHNGQNIYTVYTCNRLPCSDKSIPIVDFFNKDYQLHAFDAQCWFRDHTSTSKLEPRYNQSDSTRWIWDTTLKKTIILRDYTFSEEFSSSKIGNTGKLAIAKENTAIEHGYIDLLNFAEAVQSSCNFCPVTQPAQS